MRITTSITWDFGGVVTHHEFYEYDGVVDKCCGASADMKAIQKSSKDLALNSAAQAKEVFGDDSKVFNAMYNEFLGIFSGGPMQMGFSQNELNAMQARAKQQSSVGARNAMSAVKGAQSAFGGGNTSNPSGARIAEQTDVANAMSASEADTMNKINMANWETGRENFWKAGEGLGKTPSVFANMPGMTEAATKSSENAMTQANQVDQANHWWVAPVEKLAGAGMAFATGGLSGIGSAGGFMGGAKDALGGWAKNNA